MPYVFENPVARGNKLNIFARLIIVCKDFATPCNTSITGKKAIKTVKNLLNSKHV